MKRKPNSMSKILILPIFALLFLGITSCSKDDNGVDKLKKPNCKVGLSLYKGLRYYLSKSLNHVLTSSRVLPVFS
ncbi:Uncharacterised protein [Sphingobacterium daejeonense]|nr:Uncharacterised protein [Sphingobacterium daejeonense]